jgi:hypothetical protein
LGAKATLDTRSRGHWQRPRESPATVPVHRPMLSDFAQFVDVLALARHGYKEPGPTGCELEVGPQSAGAKPGPVCFGFGGTEPTVTDSDVALGILHPERFLGGTMPLDRASPSGPSATRRRSRRRRARGGYLPARSRGDGPPSRRRAQGPRGSTPPTPCCSPSAATGRCMPAASPTWPASRRS